MRCLTPIAAAALAPSTGLRAAAHDDLAAIASVRPCRACASGLIPAAPAAPVCSACGRVETFPALADVPQELRDFLAWRYLRHQLARRGLSAQQQLERLAVGPYQGTQQETPSGPVVLRQACNASDVWQFVLRDYHRWVALGRPLDLFAR